MKGQGRRTEKRKKQGKEILKERKKYLNIHIRKSRPFSIKKTYKNHCEYYLFVEFIMGLIAAYARSSFVLLQRVTCSR